MTGKRQDQLADSPPKNKGYGTRKLYVDSNIRIVADLIIAYKWPIVAFLSAFILVFSFGWLDIPEIPVEVWSLLFYAGAGSFVGIPVAYGLVRWLDSPEGVELLDIDGVTDDHRHLRVGPEFWDKLEVRSPWGSVVGTESLKPCTINGLTGYECLDFRVQPDGTPVCVTTWLGEESSTTMRAYKSALFYARRRLQRQAEKASMLEANIEPMAREAAETVVYELVRTSERSGTPKGDEIEGVIESVMSDFGLDDPLKDDEIDGLDEWEPGNENRQNGHETAEATRKQ